VIKVLLLIAAVASWGNVKNLVFASNEVFDVYSGIEDSSPQATKNITVSHVSMNKEFAFSIEAFLDYIKLRREINGPSYVSWYLWEDSSSRSAIEFMAKSSFSFCSVPNITMHYNNSKIMGWSLPSVFNGYSVMQFSRRLIKRCLAFDNADIRPHLPLVHLTGNIHYINGSLDALAGLAKGGRDVNYTSGSNHYRRYGSYDHPESPVGHFLLRLQIVLGALGFLGGLYLLPNAFNGVPERHPTTYVLYLGITVACIALGFILSLGGTMMIYR